MPGRAYIVATALKDPITVLREQGGDAEGLCRRIDTDPNPRPDGRLSLRAFVGFAQAAAEQLRTPGFGWSVGSRFDLENIGPLGEAVQRAPTLGAALRLFSDAFAMVQSDSTIALNVEADEAVLSYRILDPEIWPRDQDAELTLAVLTRLVRRAAGATWQPCELTFEHGPNGTERMAASVPPCRVSYRAPSNRLRFPARLLSLPLPTGDRADFRSVARSLTGEAHRVEGAAPIAIRVRREILDRLGSKPVGQSSVAAALGMSRRSLRRHLESQGRSFSALLAECRVGVARRMLADPQVPLAEIAERLNYSDATAFERAFRSRVGITPAQFRLHSARRPDDTPIGT